MLTLIYQLVHHCSASHVLTIRIAIVVKFGCAPGGDLGLIFITVFMAVYVSGVLLFYALMMVAV